MANLDVEFRYLLPAVDLRNMRHPDAFVVAQALPDTENICRAGPVLEVSADDNYTIACCKGGTNSSECGLCHAGVRDRLTEWVGVVAGGNDGKRGVGQLLCYGDLLDFAVHDL